PLALVAFVALGVVFSDATGGGEAEGGSPADSMWKLVVFCFAAIGLAIAVRVRGFMRGRAQLHRLQAALTTIFRGRVEDAEKDLATLSKEGLPLIAAQAFLARAQLAERRGDAEAMLALSEAGLGHLTTYAAKMAASDILAPTLAAERALA